MGLTLCVCAVLLLPLCGQAAALRDTSEVEVRDSVDYAADAELLAARPTLERRFVAVDYVSASRNQALYLPGPDPRRQRNAKRREATRAASRRMCAVESVDQVKSGRRAKHIHTAACGPAYSNSFRFRARNNARRISAADCAPGTSLRFQQWSRRNARHIHTAECGPAFSPQFQQRAFYNSRSMQTNGGGVSCNPNDAVVVTPMERVGKRLKYLFTNHKRQCAINGIYASLSIGDMVETEEHGRAVVIDYVIKDRVIEHVEFKSLERGARGKVVREKIPSIRNLVIQIKKGKRSTIQGDGLHFQTIQLEAEYETVELSAAETKALIIQRMIERGRFNDILKVYPEERAHLDEWRAKFQPNPASAKLRASR